MIATISESNAMAQIHVLLLLLAINEGRLSEENIAIDATLYVKKRSTVERVNAYLKEYFGLNNVRRRIVKKALNFIFN